MTSLALKPSTGLAAFAALFAAAVLVAVPRPAHAVAYDIAWTGSAGYSLSGMFSFNDALLGTGPIDEADIDSLMVEGFLNGSSIGTWDWLVDGLSGGANLNFNFDATSETFRTGGAAASTKGQQWNTAICGSTFAFGFFSGNATQGFCLPDGSMAGMILTANSTLVATRKTDIPEPATLGLLGLSLAGLGAGPIFGRVRRRVASQAA